MIWSDRCMGGNRTCAGLRVLVTPVSRRIFVFRVDYSTKYLEMQEDFAAAARKIQAGRGASFQPEIYTSMVLASRRRLWV